MYSFVWGRIHSHPGPYAAHKLQVGQPCSICLPSRKPWESKPLCSVCLSSAELRSRAITYQEGRAHVAEPMELFCSPRLCVWRTVSTLRSQQVLPPELVYAISDMKQHQQARWGSWARTAEPFKCRVCFGVGQGFSFFFFVVKSSKWLINTSILRTQRS